MKTITFMEGQKYVAPYGMTKQGEYTPIYMIKDGVQHFISNLVKVTMYKDAYDNYHYENSIQTIEKHKQQLLDNGGQYITFYAEYNNPLDFIQWVKENDYTFEIHGELFYKCDGFTDFHGNLKEYSAAFHYRIYDQTMLQKLRDEVSKCKSYYHFKRN